MNLHEVKNQLLAAKAELEDRLRRTHAHIHHEQEPVSANFHEQSVELGNEDVVQALDLEGRKELDMIEAALERLDRGTYLNCSRCGDPIGEQRLAAVPYTEFCVNCFSED